MPCPIPPNDPPFRPATSRELTSRACRHLQTTGPVPLASYMRMCLTSDVGGYYTGAIEKGGEGKDRDQFGVKGDFVTSPEISQVFGELVGVWFVAEWLSQGRPKRGVEIIEVGPGRGTLMDDVLRVCLCSAYCSAECVDERALGCTAWDIQKA